MNFQNYIKKKRQSNFNSIKVDLLTKWIKLVTERNLPSYYWADSLFNIGLTKLSLSNFNLKVGGLLQDKLNYKSFTIIILYFSICFLLQH